MRWAVLILLLVGVDGRPEYELTLPFENSCVRPDCCAIGHNDCRTSEEETNTFGSQYEDTHGKWTDSASSSNLCLMDADGDGYSNGDELGDPCCVWTYYVNSGRPSNLSHNFYSSSRTHPSDAAEYPTSRLSCTTSSYAGATPPDLTITANVGSSNYELDWSTTSTTTCICRVQLQVSDTSGVIQTLDVPWGENAAVLSIPSGASALTVNWRTYNANSAESSLSSTTASINVGTVTDSAVDSKSLTVGSTAYPAGTASAYEDTSVIALGPLVALFGLGLTVFVLSRLAAKLLPKASAYRCLPPPMITPYGLIALCLVGVFVWLAFFLNDPLAVGGTGYDMRTIDAVSYGQACAVCMIVVLVLSHRPWAEFICAHGWETLVRYHGFISFAILALGALHAWQMVGVVGWTLFGGNGLTGTLSLILMGLGIVMAVLHRLLSRMISYDVFRYSHWLMYPPILLIAIHCLASPGGLIIGIIMMIVGLAILFQAFWAAWLMKKGNFRLIAAATKGPNVAVLLLESPKAVPITPGQWVSVRFPFCNFFKTPDSNPFTIVPASVMDAKGAGGELYPVKAPQPLDHTFSDPELPAPAPTPLGTPQEEDPDAPAVDKAEDALAEPRNDYMTNRFCIIMACGGGRFTREVYNQAGFQDFSATPVPVSVVGPYGIPPSPNPLPTLSQPSPNPLPTLSQPSPNPLPTLSQPSPNPLPTLSQPSPSLSQPSPNPLPTLSHPLPTLSQPSPNPLPGGRSAGTTKSLLRSWFSVNKMVPHTAKCMLPEGLAACDAVMFICGGSGITPAVSLMAEATRCGKPVKLLWSFRDLELYALLREPLVGAAGNDPAACQFFCTSKEAAGDSEAQAQDIVFSRPDIGSFMAETVQGFDGSVSSLGVFACGPGPIYSAIQKAFNKQLKCGGGPIKSVHYETFSFVL